jgi:uncharacterized RDD family membrane protein YckC
MIQPDEHQHHTIWTPELVEISLPLAGVARRCIAMLVDQIIITMFMVALWTVFFMTMAMAFETMLYTQSTVFMVVIVGMMLFSLVFYFLYFWGFHTLNNGQTLGKMWLSIRLVTDRGGRANAWSCFVRQLFDILDMLLFYGGISVMLILMTEREKRIADMAAGTIVILDK